MKSLFIAALVLVLAICWGCFISSSNAAPSFNVRDNHALLRVSTVSTNGRFAVYSVRHWNEQTNKATTNIEVLDIQTKVTRPLTYSLGVSDNSPVFDPTGNYVIFLSSGRGRQDTQLYYVPVNAGEQSVKPLTSLPIPIETFKVSPVISSDGAFTMLFSSQTYLECNDPTNQITCIANKNEEWEKKGPNTGYVYTKLYVRHWDQYIIEGKVSHVFAQKVILSQDALITINDPVDVMFGMNANSPIPPFGGSEQYDISKSGDSIAINLEVTKDSSVAWTTGWKIFVGTLNNWRDEKSKITVSNLRSISVTDARTQNPTFSPFNDNVLAYLAMTQPGYEADNLHFNLYDLNTQKTNQSIEPVNLDRSISSITWFDERTTIITYPDDGAEVLSLFNIVTKNVTRIIVDGHNAGPAVVVPGKSILITRDSMVAPADVYLLQRDSLTTPFALTQLTAYNRDFLAKFDLPTPEKFYFAGAMGERVQAWVVKPANFNPSVKYPVANVVHGGPESLISDSWSYRWNIQLFTNAGYAVFAINFHGSEGFGLKFKESIQGNWGSYPYQDITSGTDMITSQFPWMDKNRVCALGASYGGYSMNWLLGHNENNRYKCIVTHDGMADTVLGYYSTDELWFPEKEFKGTPFTNPQAYAQYNPINYVTKWRTPTLVIHGGHDYRLEISHGLTVFTALQRQGVPSKMLVFPQENHWTIKPQNSIMWYDNVLDWLNQWIGH
ncbi:hypothetical protein ABK040_011833 [Willaertia magna]